MARLVKCTKMTDDDGEDRISMFPEIVAAKILDFLSLKEAAQISVLSKHWKNRWLLLSSVDFDAYHLFEHQDMICFGKFPQRIPECIEWVTAMLRSRREATSEDLCRLRIRLNMGLKSRQKYVDEWLSNAFASRVQNLELDFLNNSNPIIAVSDKLSFPPFKDVYKPLTSLSLSGLKVTDEAIKSFLDYLPSLEHLKVCSSNGLVNLLVHGCQALKHLEILHCLGLKTTIVRNTSLVSFAFTWISHLELTDNPNLVIIRAFDVVSSWQFGMFYDYLPQLQILTLSVAYASCAPISIPKMRGLKQLTLILDAVQVEAIHRLTAMLMSSPKLEKLALEFLFKSGFNEKALAASEKRTFALGRPSIPLKRLKDIEVRGYNGDVAEDTILRYLLEHIVAPKLKPVVYDPRGLGRDCHVSLLRNCFSRKKKSYESLTEQFKRVVPDSTLRC